MSEINNIILVLIFLFTTFFVYSQNDSLNPLAKNKNSEPFEDHPGLIGGNDLLQSKIIYPAEAIINNVEGKVIVKVSIDTMGLPVKIDLEKGIGFGCDEEVIKAIKSTIFIPPTKNGKPIESYLYIPITFKIPQ